MHRTPIHGSIGWAAVKAEAVALAVGLARLRPVHDWIR
jgi:hypothetical protein